MAKTSPTQRSLKLLRDAGWQVAIVEKWNQYVKIRQDLWGFGDLLACAAIPELDVHRIAIIQTTTQANAAARLTKIVALPAAKKWIEAGGDIIIHGWRKVGPRGKRKVWEVLTRSVSLDDFAQPPQAES